ncbi:16S rRNA (guanine(527)-N(7))-methyltransferase RsmG [Aquincola sp. S2]|uniref:Ribosomal RNA small subunit methyltransferase G n=1 Tax=Pseudaquabacterium terrae TaxID=2732868 RepID=A0ABX2ELH1_9BURK|nr:16S rRNA (guanine(527)-N(7))-methyltransferase RsmG [Aquabacterium terrae]NRF69369.1 16S rRNA (guanine(527)-N(7))-methyltransferase RsmG [Aquabacterium terrae]
MAAIPITGGEDAAPRSILAGAAEQLGVPLDAAALDRLLSYLALMQRWNRVYNLTALREPSEMLSHHLLDCLAVLPALARHAKGRPLRILDVGSGGGLPGVVLAVAQPDWSVTCIDAVAKKSGFVRQVAGELALPNLRSVHGRVEALPAEGRFDVIVSRAFASLADFTELSRTQLAPGGVWLAMKGRAPDEEAAALPGNVSVFHVEPLRVPGLHEQRCLVWLRPHGTR